MLFRGFKDNKLKHVKQEKKIKNLDMIEKKLLKFEKKIVILLIGPIAQLVRAADS